MTLTETLTNRCSAALVVVAVLVGVFFWRDIVVAFHRRAMVTSFEGICREGPTSSRQSDYIESFMYHRDALTSLGYFERHVFPLQHIGPGAEAWRGLFRALSSAIINSTVGDFAMRGHEPTTPRDVIIWMRPGQRVRFESMISEFDVPTKRQPPEELSIQVAD